jgi:hypothetical protein
VSGERDYERESLKILIWNMIFDCPPEDAPSEHAGEYADAILAAGYRKPRQVTTAEELDALKLPCGSIVLDAAGDYGAMDARGNWRNWTQHTWDGPDELAAVWFEFPVTVLHEGAR